MRTLEHLRRRCRTFTAISGLTLAGLLASAGTAPAATTNWPQLGFSARHTGFNRDESVLSIANVGRLRAVWQTTMHGQWAWAPPVVFGSHVYIGGKGYQEFDAATGTPQGGQSVGGSVNPVAVASVAGRQRIFANTESGNAWTLAVFDRRLGAIGGYDVGGGAPAIAGGTVYMSYPVAAIDPASQTVLWRAWPAGETTAAAAAGYGRVVVASQPIVDDTETGALQAFDPVSGALQWTLDGGPLNPFSTPSLTQLGGRTMVFVGAGYFRSVVAADATTGRRLWTVPLGDYAGGGRCFAWRATSVAAFANGTVYAHGSDGLTAIDARTGAKRWTAPIGPPTDISSPAIANGVVYEANHAIDARTGAVLWTGPAGSCGTTPAVVVNGRVYYATFDDPAVAGYRYTVHAFGL
jgi:hypothetical protein